VPICELSIGGSAQARIAAVQQHRLRIDAGERQMRYAAAIADEAAYRA
jgi:hypothetical protein